MTTDTSSAPRALASGTRRASRRLIPFLGLLYLVNYLDRTNLAFAGPNGMNDALGMGATAFGFASGIFFVGYLLLEVPSNLALHKVGARRWIARILVTWGIVAGAIGFVNSPAWLYILRFLLGVAEAGFFPGILLYLTYWFPQEQRARVTAMFMVAIPLSSAIGAPLSSLLIEHGHGWFGLDGWRVMFLVEAVPAVLLGLVCWWFLDDRPAKAEWLSEEERTAMTEAIAAEDAERGAQYGVGVRQTLTQGRAWALAFVYFGIVYGLYALGFFLPTIIGGFEDQFDTSYSIVQVGLITSVPYLLGAIAMIVWNRHGDRTGERVWHVAIPAAVGGLAIPITLYLGSPLAAMIAVSICAIGIMCALPAFWALPTNYLAGAATASGLALINSVGNTAGFAGPYFTGWLADLTGSQKAGLWLVGACMIGAAILAVALKAQPRQATEQSS